VQELNLRMTTVFVLFSAIDAQTTKEIYKVPRGASSGLGSGLFLP
jgi:hypothetical protein